MKASEYLTTAAALVSGERAEEHGGFMESYTYAAEIFRSRIRAKHGLDVLLDAEDMLAAMQIVKDARAIFGAARVDHGVDECGYAALKAAAREEIESRCQATLKSKVPPKDSRSEEGPGELQPVGCAAIHKARRLKLKSEADT